MKLSKTEITDYITNLKLSEGIVPEVGDIPDIFKRVVTGFVMCRGTDSDNLPLVISYPIYQETVQDDVHDCAAGPCSDEKIINVVPPVKFTLGVWGVMPARNVSFKRFQTGNYDLDEPKFLGFEYERIPHADWAKILKELWVKRIMENEAAQGVL